MPKKARGKRISNDKRVEIVGDSVTRQQKGRKKQCSSVDPDFLALNNGFVSLVFQCREHLLELALRLDCCRQFLPVPVVLLHLRDRTSGRRRALHVVGVTGNQSLV